MSDSEDGRFDFEEALTDLIETAYRNGTTVDGSWKCSIDRNGDFHWDVQITRVEYADDD